MVSTNIHNPIYGGQVKLNKSILGWVVMKVYFFYFWGPKFKYGTQQFKNSWVVSTISFSLLLFVFIHWSIFQPITAFSLWCHSFSKKFHWRWNIHRLFSSAFVSFGTLTQKITLTGAVHESRCRKIKCHNLYLFYHCIFASKVNE